MGFVDGGQGGSKVGVVNCDSCFDLFGRFEKGRGLNI